jgi:hypothetical protein
MRIAPILKQGQLLTTNLSVLHGAIRDAIAPYNWGG